MIVTYTMQAQFMSELWHSPHNLSAGSKDQKYMRSLVSAVSPDDSKPVNEEKTPNYDLIIKEFGADKLWLETVSLSDTLLQILWYYAIPS